MKRAVISSLAGLTVLVLPLQGLRAAETTTGSGIVIGTGGEVLTSAHVVDRCDAITVQLASKTSDTAVMVARDPTNDLAVLRVRNPPSSVAAFREGAPVRAGDAVVALGYPLPTLLSSSANLTVGYVSALAGLEDDQRYLQISAPVQPGNSGGPLLDAAGHVIGVVASKLNAENVARFVGDIPQNVNFAVKAEVVRTFLDARGIAYRTLRSDQQLSPADVGDLARPFTVYVECKRGAGRIALDRADRSRRAPDGGRGKDAGAMAQQLRACEGGDAVSPDQQIAGCSEVIRSGVASGRDLAALFNYRGVAYKAKGDLDHAIADYTEAIRRDPGYAPAYNSRGIAHKARGDLDEAIADYDQAIRLNPNSAPAFNNRGYAYFAKSSYDRAVSDFDEAVKLDPHYALAYNNRGYAFFMQKNYDRAITDYDQAIRLDPLPAVAGTGGRSHVNIYVNRGVAYALKGDFDHALADYYEAIRIDPKYARAFASRGHVFRHIGNYARAISDYGEALQLDPGDVAVFADRGFALFLAGEFPRAASDLGQAIERLPEPYPMLWRFLARARAGRGAEPDATVELSAAAARLTTKAWPYPVVEFYLGKRSAGDTAAAAPGPEERCEAQFYLGEWHLLHADRAKATEALQAAKANCPATFYEYDGAVAELARIDR